MGVLKQSLLSDKVKERENTIRFQYNYFLREGDVKKKGNEKSPL